MGIGTITINNFYKRPEYEFQCNIPLDTSIFKNNAVTEMYNQIIDGHKLIVISKLISTLEPDFVYTNGLWFYFTGNYWKRDDEALFLRTRVLSVVVSNLQKIVQFYKDTALAGGSVARNVKCLINKMHKPEVVEEIIQGAKMYYFDESLFEKLDTRNHLVPFTNGVYDLLHCTFRKTTKMDLVSKTTKYKYNPDANDHSVNTLLIECIPDETHRTQVLKKLCEYLNRDISNPGICFNIDTPLLNLMKSTLGEIYPRKRPNKRTKTIELPRPRQTQILVHFTDVKVRQTFMNILIRTYSEYIKCVH
ncbi:hypothetical protein EBZ39_04150 [bacterium]|nr:hypothetical protein [bacterium]